MQDSVFITSILWPEDKWLVGECFGYLSEWVNVFQNDVDSKGPFII